MYRRNDNMRLQLEHHQPIGKTKIRTVQKVKKNPELLILVYPNRREIA